jgi:hypothetical protein
MVMFFHFIQHDVYFTETEPCFPFLEAYTTLSGVVDLWSHPSGCVDQECVLSPVPPREACGSRLLKNVNHRPRKGVRYCAADCFILKTSNVSDSPMIFSSTGTQVCVGCTMLMCVFAQSWCALVQRLECDQWFQSVAFQQICSNKTLYSKIVVCNL